MAAPEAAPQISPGRSASGGSARRPKQGSPAAAEAARLAAPGLSYAGPGAAGASTLVEAALNQSFSSS